MHLFWSSQVFSGILLCTSPSPEAGRAMRSTSEVLLRAQVHLALVFFIFHHQRWKHHQNFLFFLLREALGGVLGLVTSLMHLPTLTSIL